MVAVQVWIDQLAAVDHHAEAEDEDGEVGDRAHPGAAPAGRKWTSTSKPMWKFSRTPTAAPRKMNQLMTMIEAGSVQLGLAFST